MQNKVVDYSLYLVTERNMLKDHDLFELTSKVIDNGVTCIQLREKNTPTDEFLGLAGALKEILKNTSVPLIINDRVDIALAVGAEGVHLGQNDMPPKIARKLLGPDAIIGLSLDSVSDFAKFDTEDIDYLAVSGIFPTSTKETQNLWGLEGLKEIRQRTALPLVAIGGIDLHNAKSVLDNGADGLAVVSYLCASEDPADSARQMKEIIRKFFG